nr:reverse transcriptase domain-containing protein [Tanacetum cinerariifolium]
MMAIFYDMIEKTMEVFMDDFSVFGNSFETYLSHLDKMLKWCEDTNLCLNSEKSHFMVKEGIVRDHKISKNGIEVDKAKVDVIAKLPHPTTVKGTRSFLGHAGFYRRFIQYFSKIARPMTRLLEKDTPLIFSKECIEAFQSLKKKLTEAPILVAPDWDLLLSLCVPHNVYNKAHQRSIDHIDKSHEDPHSGHNKDIVVEDSMNHMDKKYSFHYSPVLTHNEAGTEADNHNQIENHFHMNHTSKSRMWGVEGGKNQEGIERIRIRIIYV